MNKDISRYLRKIKKHLYCSPKTRSYLLDHFRESLSSFLDENPEPDYQQLIAAFGPPEEMAAVIMEGVSDAERRFYRKRKNMKIIFAGIAAALFIVFSIYVFFLKELKTITLTDELILETAVKVDD